MADKFQREIVLDDKLLVSMVQKKGELVEKGRAIARTMEDLSVQHAKVNEEHDGLMVEVNNLKRDIIHRVRKVGRSLLDEYELPVTTLLKDGKVVLIVTNGLDEFKESFKGFDKWNEAVPRKPKKETLADNK